MSQLRTTALLAIPDVHQFKTIIVTGDRVFHGPNDNVNFEDNAGELKHGDSVTLRGPVYVVSQGISDIVIEDARVTPEPENLGKVTSAPHPEPKQADSPKVTPEGHESVGVASPTVVQPGATEHTGLPLRDGNGNVDGPHASDDPGYVPDRGNVPPKPPGPTPTPGAGSSGTPNK